MIIAHGCTRVNQTLFALRSGLRVSHVCACWYGALQLYKYVVDPVYTIRSQAH